MSKKVIAILAAAILTFTVFGGCKKKENGDNNTASTASSQTSSVESAPDPNDKILGYDVIEGDSGETVSGEENQDATGNESEATGSQSGSESGNSSSSSNSGDGNSASSEATSSSEDTDVIIPEVEGNDNVIDFSQLLG